MGPRTLVQYSIQEFSLVSATCKRLLKRLENTLVTTQVEVIGGILARRKRKPRKKLKKRRMSPVRCFREEESICYLTNSPDNIHISLRIFHHPLPPACLILMKRL